MQPLSKYAALLLICCGTAPQDISTLSCRYLVNAADMILDYVTAPLHYIIYPEV
jgi:hypothetical protein